MEKLKVLFDKILNEEFSDATVSNKRNKSADIEKVKLRQIDRKGMRLVQITEYTKKQVFHKNFSFEDTVQYLLQILKSDFKQCQLNTSTKEYHILVNKKGHAVIKEKAGRIDVSIDLHHDKSKSYLLKEGEPVDFLVELGVMNRQGMVIKAKYDKFRQINRFLEFVNDVVPRLPAKREIRIIDFGCGKSYLTFAIYYFLKNIKGLQVHITGLDLKEDVIKNCNALAQKLGYDQLEFRNGDIADYTGEDEADMVVTLHACDTATDYAIAKEVEWNAKVILSVPCCQHELNRQIHSEMLSPILKYGILKERMAALITDGIRAELLEEQGYDTQILEFIDMEHTPKNLLIRAVKRHSLIKPKSESQINNGAGVYDLMEELHVSPTICKLFGKCENSNEK